MRNQNDSAAIARLRQERTEFEESPEGGISIGRRWARERATYPQLRSIGLLRESLGASPLLSHGRVSELVAAAVSPDVHQREYQDIANKLFEQKDAIIVLNSWALDWIAGAVSVLKQVEAGNAEQVEAAN